MAKCLEHRKCLINACCGGYQSCYLNRPASACHTQTRTLSTKPTHPKLLAHDFASTTPLAIATLPSAWTVPTFTHLPQSILGDRSHTSCPPSVQQTSKRVLMGEGRWGSEPGSSTGARRSYRRKRLRSPCRMYSKTMSSGRPSVQMPKKRTMCRCCSMVSSSASLWKSWRALSDTSFSAWMAGAGPAPSGAQPSSPHIPGGLPSRVVSHADRSIPPQA